MKTQGSMIEKNETRTTQNNWADYSLKKEAEGRTGIEKYLTNLRLLILKYWKQPQMLTS